MDGKKIFQRVLSATLIAVMMINYCDTGLLRQTVSAFTITNGQTRSAITTASTQWTSKRGKIGIDSSNGPKSGYWNEDDPENGGFWADTSKIPVKWLNVYDEEEAPDGVIEVVDRVTISKKVAVGRRISKLRNGNDTSTFAEAITADDAVENGLLYEDAYVGDKDNVYSNILDDDKQLTVDDSGLYYTIEPDPAFDTYDTNTGVVTQTAYYRQYYVSTAKQLAYLLYMYKNSITQLKSDTTEIAKDRGGATSQYVAATKVGIVLLCDIDLGGYDGNNWVGYANTGTSLEIDGNNHTIYNGHTGKFLSKDNKYAIHDVTFSHYYLNSNGMFGESNQYAYFSNVNWENCVNVGSSSLAIVLGKSYAYCYFKNCSIKNSYIRGSSSGHCGMFASFNGDNAPSGTCVENPEDGFKYYTEVPDLVTAELAWFSSTDVTKAKTDSKGNKLSNQYPSIYENCATTDCGVYETGDKAAHSGTFISCMRGDIIFRDCFSNSSIYGSRQLGGFIGAVIGTTTGFDYFDPITNESCITNAVFENCFSSGVVEGSKKLGGFIGMVYDDVRATSDEKLEPAVAMGEQSIGYTSMPQAKRGKVIFKNCYSTASVGMASLAEQVGGFIGVLRGDVWATGEERKHRFINCYAAGEVGGVADSLDTTVYNTGMVGGFVGVYCPEDYADDIENTLDEDANVTEKNRNDWLKNNYQYISDNDDITTPTNTAVISGIFTNCYYDKQTTAMRERAVGAYPEYEIDTTKAERYADKNYKHSYYYKATGYYYNLTDTLTGITGVYTQTSDLKGVEGLTDTDKIMDRGTPNEDSAWSYVDGYYPQLKAYTEVTERELGSAKKVLSASLYSQASTATVFLDHYDKIMDYNTGIDSKQKADETVYDTVRDITSEFTFTSDGNSDDMETKSGVATNLGWRIDTDRNTGSGYFDTLGGDNGFNASFDSSGTVITDKNYSPSVLILTPAKDDASGKYIFNCYEFSVGKQYLEVVACEDKHYEEWAKLQSKYEDYEKKLAKFESDRTNYIGILDLKTDATDEEIAAELFNAIDERINLDGAEDEAAVAQKLEQALALGKALVNDAENFTEEDKEQALALYKLKSDTGYTDEQLLEAAYNDLSQFSLYPLVRPTEDDDVMNWASVDFEKYAEKGAVGRRSLRLIPSAYIDAGGMININVNETDKNNIINDITLENGVNDERLSRFDHTLGVIYVSTQDTPLWYPKLSTTSDFTNEILNTRLVDYKYGSSTSYFYGKNGKQVVVDRDTMYTVKKEQVAKYYADGQFSKANLNTDNVFALYSHYPGYGIAAQKEEQSDEDYKAAIKDTAEMGFTEMVDEVSLGGFYPQDIWQTDYTEGAVGRTQVKVYRTNKVTVYYDEDGKEVSEEEYDPDKGKTAIKLERKNAVDMTDATNLAKWSGLANFASTDKGYYYMTYYWRLTDGRYISADKLVHIDSSIYTVDMITGVADATGDSFHNGKAGEYTDIDCDVTLDEVENWEKYSFPSDRYDKDNDGDWTDYATGEYNYNYGFTYPETDGDYDTDTDYWSKGVELKTGSDGVTVAWRKNADYSLTKLIIMVRKNEGDAQGSWLPMTVAIFDDGGNVTLDDSNVTYSYAYSSMKVTQDPSTKLFSVTETENTVKRFAVKIDAGLNDDTVKSIQFKFTDMNDGGESNVQLTDDIKVVALFKTVAAEVNVEKYALIDDGTGPVTYGTDDNGENLPLYKADAYRNIDNLSFDDDEQRAILFGDTVIYRMKVQNDGVYNANNVIVKDTIPDGCTLVPNSVAIYRQSKTYKRLDTEDSYGELTKIGSKAEFIDDDMANNYETEQSYWQISEDNKKITWILNPVSMNDDYYVQYEVKVDGDYNKFKEVVNNSIKELVNQADYTYVYINGDLYNSTETTDNLRGSYNEYYAKNAVFNVTSNENDGGNGKYSYTINFSEQKANVKSYVQSVINEIPLGYKLVGSAEDIKVEITNGETVSDVAVKKEISADGTYFTIKPVNENAMYFGTGSDSEKMSIKITFAVEEDANYSGDIPVRRENESIISFSKVSDDKNDSSDIMRSTITKVDSPTNEVRSAVRWLYLNVEKEIPERDDSQVFLFKIVNKDDKDSVLLTDITASLKVADANGEKYVGNSLVEITKRGEYVVNETDWSNTDYNQDKTVYSVEDISVPELSGDDKTEYMGDINCKSGADGYASVYLPRYMYASTAFPLWAVENSDGDVIAPTVTCKNTPSEYAWLSAQQSVENSFTFPTADSDSTSDTAATLFAVARAKAATSKQAEDDVTTPSAIITSGIELKDEDDEEEEV